MASTLVGKKWNWLTNGPIGQISQDQARRRYGAREPFVVAMCDEESGRVAVVVEMAFSGAYCTVSFIDDQGRVVESVSYTEEPAGTLFAHQVARHFYGPESRSPSGGEVLLYREDGVFAREVSPERGVVSRSEGTFEAGRNRVQKPPGRGVEELVVVTRGLLQNISRLGQA